MKTLLTTALLATASLSFNASADKNVEYRLADNSFESQVCFVAATRGLDTARNLVEENGQSFGTFRSKVSCNGVALTNFAKTIPATNEQNIVKKIKLIASTSNDASQICLDAVVIGVDAAIAKHDAAGEVVFCNSQSITQFAKRFEGREVSL